MFLCYVINPPDLLEHCYGCGAALDICHSLDWNKEDLITARNNYLCDGVAKITSKAFTPTHIREYIKI